MASDDIRDGSGDTEGNLPLGVISPGATVIVNIDDSGDTDCFALTLKRGITYHFDSEVISFSGKNFSPSFNFEKAIDNDGFLFTPVGSEFDYTATESKTYYFLCESSGDNEGGQYKISVSAGFKDDARDYFSHTVEGLPLLALNKTTTGNLEIVNDKDLFQIELDAGVKYRFDLTGKTSSNDLTLDIPQIALLGSNGLLVVKNDNISDSASVPLQFTPTKSGIYYINVQASVIYDQTGTYSLKASIVPSPDVEISASSVTEAPALGANVGTLDVINGDANEFYNYELLDDAGGRFVLDGSLLRVIKPLALDYEQAKSHAITVQVTDTQNHSFQKTLTIDVIDVNPEKVTGDSQANRIKGGSKADTLNGGKGMDMIWGGKGHDAFVFDTKLGSKNVDTIGDFSHADDTIRLDHDVFKGVDKGKLPDDAFHLGKRAADKEDRILYDKKHGDLYFDRDGSKSQYGPVKFAHLDDNHGKAPVVDHTDFLMV